MTQREKDELLRMIEDLLKQIDEAEKAAKG